MPRRLPADRLLFEAARHLLGLPRWKMRLAASSGLLLRDSLGRFERAAVEAAAEGPVFRERLYNEELLVSLLSAEYLGISKRRFMEAVGLGLFIPHSIEQWSRGEAKLYRRADLDAGRDALGAWLAVRRPTPSPDDPQRALRRRTAEVRRRQQHAAARSWAQGRFVEAESLQGLDRELAIAAAWLDLLERWEMTMERYSGRPMIRAKHRRSALALLERVQALRLRALELLVPTGQVSRQLITELRPHNVRYCPSCSRIANRDRGWNFGDDLSIGCKACVAHHDFSRLAIEIPVAARSENFLVSWAEATAWPLVGDNTPRTQASPQLMDWARGPRSLPRWQFRPARISNKAWRAMSADEQRAAIERSFDRTATRYLRGDCPQETVPSWLAGVPRNERAPRVQREPLDYYQQKALPVERVMGELAIAARNLTGEEMETPAA